MNDAVRALIAVVDDESSVRSSLARLLRSAKYEASTYPSGEEFLESLDEGLPDCLILDLRMPGLDGFDVMDHLASVGRPVPVVILTSFPSPDIQRRALREGAAVFLEKPVGRSALLDALDVAMSTGIR